MKGDVDGAAVSVVVVVAVVAASVPVGPFHQVANEMAVHVGLSRTLPVVEMDDVNVQLLLLLLHRRRRDLCRHPFHAGVEHGHRVAPAAHRQDQHDCDVSGGGGSRW